MKKLYYSAQYKRKLLEIKKYLDIRFGAAVRKKVFKTITDRLHQLQKYEESGVSLRAVYGIDSDYRYIFIAHNYVFYRVDDDSIKVLNIYNEREDYIRDLFGISSVSEESEAYWDEIERNSDSNNSK